MPAQAASARTATGQLQPGDVLVVDLFGKKENAMSTATANTTTSEISGLQTAINHAGAMAFADWITSAEGQAAVAAFKINGVQMFFPSAVK